MTTICDGENYRYGYNGQMKTNEWAGLGNHYQYKAREYDTRTGRFISVDPLFAKYPWNGSYNFSEDKVIDGKDLEGKEFGFGYLVDAASTSLCKIGLEGVGGIVNS